MRNAMLRTQYCNITPYGNRKASILMTQTQFEIGETMAKMGQASPYGYVVALHIEYTTPKFLFQTYTKKWLDYYSQNGLVMSDPTVMWSFENTGAIRWSGLDDPAGVLIHAAEHGYVYGVSIAIDINNSRSMAGFARHDREFTDSEISEMAGLLEKLHIATTDKALLSAETIQQLKNMSVMVTHPGS
jgi:LuxR family transcriptional regulator